MPAVRIALHISPEEFAAYYNGSARYVLTRGRDGRTVQFPAGILRSHLRHDGIHGEFLLTFDQNNKLVSLTRLEG